MTFVVKGIRLGELQLPQLMSYIPLLLHTSKMHVYALNNSMKNSCPVCLVSPLCLLSGGTHGHCQV